MLDDAGNSDHLSAKVLDRVDAKSKNRFPDRWGQRDGKVSTLLQLESPWAPTDVAVFGDIVYVLEFLHTPGDDRLEWMPRVRKITPDGRSTVIVTIDRMPGARPSKSATRVSYNVSWVELLYLLLLSFSF